MAIPDRWNPRVWLRDWLLKPTAAELASTESMTKSLSVWVARLEEQATRRGPPVSPRPYEDATPLSSRIPSTRRGT